MVNVLTNNTATIAEAERVLEAVWPEPAAQKVKTNTLPAAAARLRSPRRSYRLVVAGLAWPRACH